MIFDLFILSAVGVLCETVLLRVAPSLMSRLALLPIGLSRRLPTPGGPAEALRTLPATVKAADYLSGWDDQRSTAWVRASLFLVPFSPFVARVVIVLAAPAKPAGYRQAADPAQDVTIRVRWLPVPVSLYLVLAQLMVGFANRPANPGGSSTTEGLLFFGGATLVVLVFSYRRARAALTAVVNEVEAALTSIDTTGAQEEL